jgi:hypothetical protein
MPIKLHNSALIMETIAQVANAPDALTPVSLTSVIFTLAAVPQRQLQFQIYLADYSSKISNLV